MNLLDFGKGIGRSMKKRIAFIIAACLAFGLTGCEMELGKKKEEKEKGPKPEEAVPVEVTTLERGMIESVLQATANLEAEEEVKVYSRASNPVIELLVEEGDRVEKDQVLLRLLNETQKIQVDKTVARLEKARKDHKRQEDLYKKELITQQAFNDASYDLKQAELDHATSVQDLEYTEVRAPINGTITQRMVKLGDMVNVNQHLFDIVDFNSLVARVYLPEKNLVALAVGQPARIAVQALRDQAFRGSILRIAPTVDAGTGTVKVTVKVDELGPLRPGMFVDVQLVLDVHPSALLVPKRALVYDSDQIFVFRIFDDEEGKTRAERLLVNPVLMDKSNVEPGEGLNEGDRIVIAGQTGLKDKALISILNSPEEASSPFDQADNVTAAGISPR